MTSVKRIISLKMGNMQTTVEKDGDGYLAKVKDQPNLFHLLTQRRKLFKNWKMLLKWLWTIILNKLMQNVSLGMSWLHYKNNMPFKYREIERNLKKWDLKLFVKRFSCNFLKWKGHLSGTKARLKWYISRSGTSVVKNSVNDKRGI